MTETRKQEQNDEPEFLLDAEWAKFITCPYCGEADEETSEYPHSLRFDGDTTKCECPYCHKSFTVTLGVTYDYTSTPLPVEGASHGE